MSQIFTYNTGKLAKEKGFDEPAQIIYYNPSKRHGDFFIQQASGYGRTYKYYKNKPKDNIERIHLTTQTILQKWLREQHNIHIYVKPVIEKNNYIKFCYRGTIVINKIEPIYVCVKDNYEDALEETLFEALKKIN